MRLTGRFILKTGIALSLLLTLSGCQKSTTEPVPSKTELPLEPTPEQLEEAKRALDRMATYGIEHDPKAMRSRHYFLVRIDRTEEELKRLPNLPFEFGLDFSFTFGLTDAGLKEFARLDNLTSLKLSSHITDAGLKELKQIKKLTILGLEHTKVTDAGMKELSNLTNLTRLSLIGTKVTDASIKELKQLTKLTVLNLPRFRVTEAGVKELQQALPNCKIWY